MKNNRIILTTAALAAMLLGTVSSEAGGSRYYSRSRCDRAPVVVVPQRSWYPRPVLAPVYYRPAIVSSGWGYPASTCNTTVYRGYHTWNGGYAEHRETVCRPVYSPPYPVYQQPSCGYRGGGYYPDGYHRDGYRSTVRGVTIRF